MTSEAEIIQDKTAGELYDFVQTAARKKVISESLATHLRGAIKKIFFATVNPGEFWRDLPLVPDISERVAILRERNDGSCSEETIKSYQNRYDRSLRLLVEHYEVFSTHPATSMNPTAPPTAISEPAPTQNNSPDFSSPAQASVSSAQTRAIQKVLAASLKFQQEVLSALSLLTNPEGGTPPASA